MTVVYFAEPGILRAVAKGDFSLESAKRTFREGLDELARHGVKKVLIDGRQVEGDPETIERFYYGEYVANAVSEYAGRGVSPSTEFAYVLFEPVLDPWRFGETVAVNRGMRVKVFDNLEAAYTWLGVTPAHEVNLG